MDRVELLTVEERFALRGLGLVLAPDFAVPAAGWPGARAEVAVVPPGGDPFEAVARLDVMHFQIRDPDVPVGARWRVVVALIDVARERVPVGSRLLAPSEIAVALLGPRA